MIDIENKAYAPNLSEISEYIGNPAYDTLQRYMESEYQALSKVEYSGDKVLLGWNVKYKKAGRTLCTIYPRKDFFKLLLVVGPKEKQRVEELLPSLSPAFRKVYHETQEGMGQRWMIFELHAPSPMLDDILKIVQIRRESK